MKSFSRLGLMNEEDLKKIVRKCYLDYLNREPDDKGLKHYVNLMKTKKITKQELIDTFKASPEYKLSHPVELESDTAINVRMKKEWNERAKMNPLFVIATDHSESEEDFWASGVTECNFILGKDIGRFQKIIENKDPSKMNVLEIGCGIGRILIPMGKIFGNVVGIDVSSEMVMLGQKHVADIPNCSIVENNGIDLSKFTENSFDFCYSFIVFQHIPDKNVVEKYISEVSRVLKPNCLFRFQVRGTITTKPNEITTWDGVQFTSEEIHKIADLNNFEIIEEGNDHEEYYWLTFKTKK
ncbi:Demethylmenaquinone methyltransferase protein [Marine Group I thaumarchaeote SCGC AAA799-P11]|uniref:Demethylmenaquinone methyltransferase protein n=1 Tax=Marine Group I thaumarchaeote SCGC AAA799-P11 TaxID=1502295 RepID=A0A087S2X7_9ARCH|nr:Demethylmenaquinone methyltransferase protein [Marine Group I thaumarchaeote SCGC AAA799-P11]